MMYCIDCGQPLETLIGTPDEGCLGYRCNNCNKQWGINQHIESDGWMMIKVKELEAENITLKKRLELIEKELEL